MSTAVKTVHYSKGRGRGLLGLANKLSSSRPGDQSKPSENGPATEPQNISAKAGTISNTPCDENTYPTTNNGSDKKLLVAMYSYTANADSPGGFKELSIKKGQLLQLLGEHPENEHWWEVENEDREVGYVPSSYVIIKEDKCLPWLQISLLKSEEEERKERVKRLNQTKSAAEGKGFGPAPKSTFGAPNSAYKIDPDRYYCAVCDKRLNGPKPYSAHMASRAHKEELELREYYK